MAGRDRSTKDRNAGAAPHRDPSKDTSKRSDAQIAEPRRGGLPGLGVEPFFSDDPDIEAALRPLPENRARLPEGPPRRPRPAGLEPTSAPAPARRVSPAEVEASAAHLAAALAASEPKPADDYDHGLTLDDVFPATDAPSSAVAANPAEAMVATLEAPDPAAADAPASLAAEPPQPTDPAEALNGAASVAERGVDAPARGVEAAQAPKPAKLDCAEEPTSPPTPPILRKAPDPDAEPAEPHPWVATAAKRAEASEARAKARERVAATHDATAAEDQEPSSAVAPAKAATSEAAATEPAPRAAAHPEIGAPDAEAAVAPNESAQSAANATLERSAPNAETATPRETEYEIKTDTETETGDQAAPTASEPDPDPAAVDRRVNAELSEAEQSDANPIVADPTETDPTDPTDSAAASPESAAKADLEPDTPNLAPEPESAESDAGEDDAPAASDPLTDEIALPEPETPFANTPKVEAPMAEAAATAALTEAALTEDALAEDAPAEPSSGEAAEVEDEAAPEPADPAADGQPNLTHPDIAAATAAFESRRSANTEEDFIDRHKLGEFLHGARATLGKFNLKEVQRDLKIKARYLEAIETVDLERLPADAYIPGYVRAYIGYLANALPPELTAKRAYEKFLSELVAKRAERDGAGPSGDVASKLARAVGMSGPARAPAPSPSRDPSGAPRSEKMMSAEALVAARMKMRTEAARAREKSASEAEQRVAAAAKGGSHLPGGALKVQIGRALSGDGAEPRAEPASGAQPVSRRRADGAPRPQLRITQDEIRARARTAEQAWRSAEAAAIAGLQPTLWERAKPWAALGAMASLAIATLYGVWFGLSSAQRVIGDDPTESLTVVAHRDPLGRGADATGRPSADAYRDGGVLTRVYEPPVTARSDGPISEIDPRTVGVYARPPLTPEQLAAEEPIDPADRFDPALRALLGRDPAAPESAAPSALDDAPLGPTDPAALEPEFAGWPTPEYALRAVDQVWVSIQAQASPGVRVTLFEGTLEPGEMVALPADRGPLRVRAGNAGGAMLVIDGAAYGPIGAPGAVRTLVGVTPGSAQAEFEQNAEVTQRIADEAAESAYRGPIAALYAPEPDPTAALAEDVLGVDLAPGEVRITPRRAVPPAPTRPVPRRVAPVAAAPSPAAEAPDARIRRAPAADAPPIGLRPVEDPGSDVRFTD